MLSIASIRGRVRGIGNEFVLACDMRFASAEKAILGQPEVGFGLVLKEHGFHMEAALGFSNGWCTRVVYVSETSAIAVDRNTDRRRAEVILAKLTDVRLPPWRTGYPLVPLDYVLLDSVVDARAPERQRWHTIPGKSYEEQVSFWLRRSGPSHLNSC